MKQTLPLLLTWICLLACACRSPTALSTGTPAAAVLTPTATSTPLPTSTPTPTLTPTPSVTPQIVQIVTPVASPTPVSILPEKAAKALAWLRAVWGRYGGWTLLLVLVPIVLYVLFKIGEELIKDGTKEAVAWIKDQRVNLAAKLSRGPDKHERMLLENTLDRYGYLELRGFVRKEVVIVSLESIYVPLFTQATSSGRSPSRRKSVPAAGGELGGMLAREGTQEPVPLTTLLPRHRCLVLIGQAGAGKSTFVRHVALSLAHALLDRKPGLARQRLDWPVDRLAVPLPILLPLGGFGLYLREQSEADKAAPHTSLLLGYMRRHFRDLGLPEDFFERRLNQKEHCLVLLDGLDEVARLQDRVLISETVTLLAQQYENARFVLTCRPEGYRSGAQLGGEFQHADVQALRWPEDITAFVVRWNEAVLKTTPGKARENVQDLIRRLEERDRVRALADNPLLLTVMIIVHFNVGRLPERRAALYDNATELLLDWDTRLRRTLAEPPPWLAAINAPGKRIYLEELAYHWQWQGIPEDRREAIVAFLAPLFLSGSGEDKEKQAKERAGVFLNWVIERSYLLRPLDTTLTFYRRAFHEYLAARRLAREPELVGRTLGALGQDAGWWQETVLLTLDHLSASDPERAAALLRGLLDAPDDPPGSQAHLVLVGEALAEAAREHLPWQLVEDAQTRLRDAITHPTPAFAIPRRVAAGRALAVLGDERPGICSQFPVLVEIPAGPFKMGSPPEAVEGWKQWQRDKMEREREDPEKPIDEGLYQIYAALLDAEAGVHEIDLPAFYIARCPVTVAQYRPFVEGGGYKTQRFWTEAGWAWLRGESGEREELPWNRERPVEDRREPAGWHDHRYNAPNQPVVGVTWFEATAYCRWLTEQVAAAHCPLQVWRAGRIEAVDPADLPGVFCLPTEAEWEKAARGVDGRVWPWGDEWDATKANNAEDAGEWTTTPVGLYAEAASASPYGLLDAVGNTWEWTSTRWGDDWRAPAYPAPYDAGDGREDAEGATWRVVRGGSWYEDRMFVRCGARSWHDPDYWDDNVGFRVARRLPCAAR